jgi:hypothetical protein
MWGCITPKIIHSSLKFLTILFPNLNVKKGKSFTLKEDFKSFVGVLFQCDHVVKPHTLPPPPPKAPIMGPRNCTFSVTKAFHKAMCMFVISQFNLHLQQQSLKLETKHSWNGK